MFRKSKNIQVLNALRVLKYTSLVYFIRVLLEYNFAHKNLMLPRFMVTISFGYYFKKPCLSFNPWLLQS